MMRFFPAKSLNETSFFSVFGNLKSGALVPGASDIVFLVFKGFENKCEVGIKSAKVKSNNRLHSWLKIRNNINGSKFTVGKKINKSCNGECFPAVLMASLVFKGLNKSLPFWVEGFLICGNANDECLRELPFGLILHRKIFQG